MKKINYPEYRKPAAKRTCPICKKEFAARGLKTHIKLEHQVEEIIKEVQANNPVPDQDKILQRETVIADRRKLKVTFGNGFPKPYMEGARTVAIFELEGDECKIRKVNRYDLQEMDAVIADLQELRRQYFAIIDRYRSIPQLRDIEQLGLATMKKDFAYVIEKNKQST